MISSMGHVTPFHRILGLGIKQVYIVFTALNVSRTLCCHSLPVVVSWVPTFSINVIPCCVKLISLALPPRSSTLRICCSFRSCSDLVTASNTLLPDLKMIDIVLCSSETSFNLPQCNYKLYKWSFVNRCLFHDCYWHVLLCFARCVSHFHSATSYYHFLYFNWMAFVRLNKRYVMLSNVVFCV